MQLQSLRKLIPIMFIVLISFMVSITLGLQSANIILSSGFISYSVQVPPPNMWFGAGLDYKLVINRYVSITEALNSWSSHIDSIRALGLNTVRLALAFPDSGVTTHSKLVYSELDQVIELLAQNEIHVIIDLHNWNDMAGYMGSQSWVDSWADFAEYYKDDDRILAYELFNEPFTSTWHSSITGDGAGRYDGSNGIARALAECVDVIRATGDNHFIIYPDPWYWLSYDDAFWHPENWVNSAHYRSKIIVTFHQYAPNQDTIDELDDYLPDRKRRVTLWSQYCPVWLGEFGMVRKGHQVEVEYCIRWINFALESGFGFNYWMHGYTSSQQAWQYCTQVVQSSDFEGL